MKKQKCFALCILVIAVLLVSACGGSSGTTSSTSQQGSQEAEPEAKSTAEESTAAESAAGETETASASAEESAEETKETAAEGETEAASSEGVAEETAAAETAAGNGAYAWLGLQDMPECHYLDCLATYHYIREFDSYAMGLVVATTEAMDGINSFIGTDTTRSYSVDGHILSVNDSAKVYTEADMSAAVEQAVQNFEHYKESGENWVGRAFVGTGTEAIPLYSDSGDTNTYDYYEYNYPASEDLGMPRTERFYMKDGDVFAIYDATSYEGEILSESVQVIKSISGEIPEGTFDLPSLEGYEKNE